MPIASRVLPLLQVAKAFNLQISSQVSGQENELHAGLSTLVLPKFAGLAEAGIHAELLVAESSWTRICQDGVLHSLAARETFVSRICIALVSHFIGKEPRSGRRRSSLTTTGRSPACRAPHTPAFEQMRTCCAANASSSRMLADAALWSRRLPPISPASERARGTTIATTAGAISIWVVSSIRCINR